MIGQIRSSVKNIKQSAYKMNEKIRISNKQTEESSNNNNINIHDKILKNTNDITKRHSTKEHNSKENHNKKGKKNHNKKNVSF